MKITLLTSLLLFIFFTTHAQNVGIGTSTPTSKLHIVDNSTTVFKLRVESDNTPGLIGFLMENTATSSGLQIGHINNFPTYGASGENFIYSSGFSKGLNIISRNTTTGDGHISFHTSGDALTNATLYLSDDDRVGIQNEFPSATLDVIGTFQLVDGTEGASKVLTSDAAGNASWQAPSGAAGTDDDWYEVGTTTAPNNINDDIFTQGNVGIGTTTPTSKLHIVDNSANVFQLRVSADNTPGLISILAENTVTNAGLQMGHVNNFPTYGASGENYIYSSGNSTGLNIINRNATTGDGHISFHTSGDALTNATLYLSDDDRVGIQNESPSATLDVIGTFQLVDGTEGVSKVLTSDAAGNASWQVPSAAAGTDDDWYEVGTTTAPNSINDNIFTQGNVGIGTMTPTSKLHIVDHSISDNKVIIESNNTSSIINMKIENSLTTGGISMGYVNNSPTFGAVGETYLRSSNNAQGLNIINNNSTGNGHISFHTSGNAIDLATFFLSDDNKVGIQNESPSATLDVIGTFQLVDGTEGASKVLTSDATGNASWQVPSAGAGTDDDWYEVGTTTAPNSINDNIFTQGNVGVGTATPAANLDVNGYTLFRNGNNSLGTGLLPYQIRFGYNGTDQYQHFISTRHSGGAIANNAIDFYTGDGTASGTFPANAVLGMSINGGQVGVGTTTPSDLLHVYNASGNIGAKIETGTNTASDYAALRFVQGGGESGLIFTHQNDIYMNSSSTTAGDDVLLAVNQAGLELGNVGVGTITPGDKLSVYSANNTAEVSIRTGNLANRAGLLIGRTSNEGGFGAAPSAGIYSSIATAGDMVLGAYGTADDLVLANVTAGDIRFSTGTPNDSEKMTITNAGNVGIGTTTPTAKLDVEGSFQLVDGTEGASKVLTSDAAGNASWQAPSAAVGTDDDWYEVGTTTAPNSINDDIYTQGNVGVGINAPTDLLHVYGANGNNGFKVETAGNTVSDFAAIRFHQGGQERAQFFTNQNDIYLNSSSTTAGDDVLLGVGNTGIQLGNVGIATTTPLMTLHVNGKVKVEDQIMIGDGIGNATIYFNEGGVAADGFHIDYSLNSNERLGFVESGVGEHMSILRGGNIGVGTTTPTQKLEITGGDVQLDNNKGIRFYNNSGTSGTALRFDSNNDVVLGDFDNVFNGHIIFLTDANQKMIIRNSGNVGIGTNTPTALLSVNGSANKPGGGSWAVFSDARLKKNVNSYTDGLSTLLQIETKTFQYNGKAGIQDTEKEYVGIVAQDMQKIAPYMVREVDYNNEETGEKATYLEFDPSAMDFMLVNAVKEMNETMKAMKERITALEEENKALKNLTKN